MFFATGGEYQFVIENNEGMFLGGCGLNQINTAHQFANLGYWIKTSAMERDHATATVKQLISWAFAHTPLVRLEVVAAAGNAASATVATKAGAIYKGTLQKRLKIRNT